MSATPLLVLVGTGLSLASSVALLTSWCLVPGWRTLLNFVSLHQIVIGTLHQTCLISLNHSPGQALSALVALDDCLLLASLCWSLCASMVAYLKLVLAQPGKMSCEKWKATAFTYGVLLTTKAVTDCFVANAFHLTELYQVLPVKFVSMYVVLAVNLYAYVKVIVHVARCGARHALALVGVAVVCDALTGLTMSAVLVGLYTQRYDLTVWVRLFFYRLLPQAAVVLFNERSRDVWSKHLAQRRNMRSNIMLIQNI